VLQFLHDHKTIVVGHQDLVTQLHSGHVFTPYGIVSVPSRNCFHDRVRIVNDIKRMALSGADTIVFCASMASEVMMHDLVDQVPCNMIDLGSALDPYVGRHTRPAYDTAEARAALAKNRLDPSLFGA